MHPDIGAILNGSDVWFVIGSRGADGGDLGKAKAPLGKAKAPLGKAKTPLGKATAHLAAVPSLAGELGRQRQVVQQVVQPQDAVVDDNEGAAAGQAGLGSAEPEQVVLCDSSVLTHALSLSVGIDAFQLTSRHAL